MSTSPGSRSASRTTRTSSSGPDDIAADHHRRARVRGGPAAGRASRRPATFASWRPGCRSPAPDRRRPRRPSRCGDHLPRLEPVGQRDHRVVVAQRGADPTGDGLGGGHRRDDPNLHSRPFFGLFQHGGGHREDPGIARRHHRDGPTLLGQRAGQPRTRGFVGVVAGVTPLAVARRDAVQVAAVADQVGRGGQLAPALRRHPVAVAGAQTHHRDGAGDATTAVQRRPPGSIASEKYGTPASSTSAAGRMRCPAVLARST